MPQIQMGSSIDNSCDNHEALISVLHPSSADIPAALHSSGIAGRGIADADRRLLLRLGSLADNAGPATRPHSEAVASKAGPHARIKRPVPPALSSPRLLAFAGSEHIAERADSVDRLATAVCEQAVQFLCHTKAADRMWMWRIKEDDVATLREVTEREVGKMNLKGTFAEAVVRLHDEFRKMLRRLRHADADEMTDGGGKTDGEDRLAGGMDVSEWRPLGSTEQRAVLRRLAEALASNDCLAICIDIFAKARYHQATKALKRLIKNLDPVNKHTRKDIGRMDCESLDPTISLWISHLSIAVATVLPAEKHLCIAVLSSVLDGTVWSECFANISHRIMLDSFRFCERFALSPNEPHKLINLLKLTDTVRCLRPAISALFDDCVPKISARARDLEQLLVGSAFAAFSALPLRINGFQNDFPPPADASVPAVVVSGVHFLKCVAADRFEPSTAQPNPSKNDLKETFTVVLDALQSNVEAIWEKFKDRMAAHVFAMNTNWYIYIKTRGSELAMVVGEEEMRRRYKAAAEAAAYAYQAEAWEPMARMLGKGEVGAFMEGMKGNLRRHRRWCGIQDAGLREQIKEAVMEMLVRAGEGYLHACSGVVQGRGFVVMEDVKTMLGWIFDDGGGKGRRRREKNIGDEMLASAAAAGKQKSKGRRTVRPQFLV